MQSLELTIDLDRGDRRYKPGESLSGRVRVAPGTKSAGRPLTAVLWWETSGRGDKDRGEARVIVLAVADAAIGCRTYPFSFEAPDGPLSYAGQYVQLSWFLEARLSLPTVLGEVVRHPIVIEADPDSDPPPIAADQLASVAALVVQQKRGTAGAPLDRALVERVIVEQETEARNALPKPKGCGTPLWIVWLVSALYVGLSAGGEYEVVERLLGFGCAGLSLIVVASVFISMARERRARDVLAFEVEVTPRVVRPGEGVRCTVRAVPAGPTEILGIEATLVAQERALGSDIDGKARSCLDLHRSTAVLAKACRLAGSEYWRIDGRLEIPADAPGSFHAAHNEVTWEVVVTVTLPRRVTLSQVHTVVVHPTRRPPSPAP